jgi:predicted phosphate transport protein (TIGR00153 family)
MFTALSLVHPEFEVPLRLRPTDPTFYDLFTESANHLVTGARILAELLGSAAGTGLAASDEIAVQMKDAEHAADETTHSIIRRVNSTFVTPFDREDIYRLASDLDDVMDHMEEAVDSVHLFGLDELPAEVAEQIVVLQRAAALTAEAMPRLRTMKDLAEYWIEINRLENTGDQVYRRIIAKLFGGEYDALTVMKYKSVVDSLEAGIDAFEHVANTIEQIAVKEG